MEVRPAAIAQRVERSRTAGTGSASSSPSTRSASSSRSAPHNRAELSSTSLPRPSVLNEFKSWPGSPVDRAAELQKGGPPSPFLLGPDYRAKPLDLRARACDRQRTQAPTTADTIATRRPNRRRTSNPSRTRRASIPSLSRKSALRLRSDQRRRVLAGHPAVVWSLAPAVRADSLTRTSPRSVRRFTGGGAAAPCSTDAIRASSG